MSTVPLPVNSPWLQHHAGLIVVGQYDGEVVDVHPAVRLASPGRTVRPGRVIDGVQGGWRETGVVRIVERQIVRDNGRPTDATVTDAPQHAGAPDK